jgi:hypothetical protein
MKSFIKILLILVSFFDLEKANAQWEYKTMIHPIDGKYKVAYTQITEGTFLKLFPRENGQVGLLMYVGFVCQTYPNVEMVFQMDTGWSNFTVLGLTSEDNKMIFLISDVQSDIYDWFVKSRRLMIRINDGQCGTDTKIFSMQNSAAALRFMME